MAKLYFYYSAMNAGKSTTLLQSNHNYRERGMDTILFIPAVDDRFGVGVINSRIGLTAEAVPFTQDFNLYEHVVLAQRAPHHNLKCVLIDEAQFLTKTQVLQLSDIVDNCKLPVLAYGLRTDFLGEPFEGSQYLLAWAEELIEIKTVCHCGHKATMNVRVDENLKPVKEGSQIEIGGNDRYISTCRRHFREGIVSSERVAHKTLENCESS